MPNEIKTEKKLAIQTDILFLFEADVEGQLSIFVPLIVVVCLGLADHVVLLGL